MISRSTRSTRSARNTLKFSVVGTTAIATTMKSNTLQGSRKNAKRCTMIRAVSSTTKMPSMM